MKRILAVACLVLGVSVAKAQESAIPDGAKGFSGQISGMIVKKGEATLFIKVDAVKKVWKGNKAEKPESLVGQTIQVGAGSSKGKDSEKVVTNTRHLAFIEKVKPGKIEIEVRAGEGAKFHLLELSKEQRKLAGEE